MKTQCFFIIKGQGPATVEFADHAAALKQLKTLTWNNPDVCFSLFKAVRGVEAYTPPPCEFDPFHGDEFPRYFKTNQAGEDSPMAIVEIADRDAEDILISHRHPARLTRLRKKDIEHVGYYEPPRITFDHVPVGKDQFIERVANRRRWASRPKGGAND
jgi:hypothetical protein